MGKKMKGKFAISERIKIRVFLSFAGFVPTSWAPCCEWTFRTWSWVPCRDWIKKNYL